MMKSFLQVSSDKEDQKFLSPFFVDSLPAAEIVSSSRCSPECNEWMNEWLNEKVKTKTHWLQANVSAFIIHK